MKIALTLSGHLRNYKLTLPSIIKFCDKFNIDIYLLFDYSEKKEHIKDVINMCKPKKVKYIKSLDACSNINMWYKIKEAYGLAKNNNIKYDYYIRGRYDILIEKFAEFKLSDLDKYKNKNVLFVGIKNYRLLFLKYNMWLVNGLSDEFFIGSEKIMNIYSNFYDIVINSNNKCLELYAPEVQFKHLSVLYNTQIVQLKILYKYVCFSELSCIDYVFIKKTGFYNSTIKYFLFTIRYIIIIVILMLFIIYLLYLKYKSDI
tara:strand:+ start:380 stop:1156 length:777 start_codon:yes stop_codon:yes gene_type:complete